MRFGGNANNGSNDGVLNFNVNNAPSNANWNYGGGNLSIPNHSKQNEINIAHTFPWLEITEIIRLERPSSENEKPYGVKRQLS